MVTKQEAFETERTRRFRARSLDAREAKTVGDIERFGCTVFQIPATNTSPRWSYTLGVYDTAGKPEILTVGLLDSTALFLLNEAARRMRKGIDLTVGRHLEMIEGVECEFRPVDPKWLKPLMGWALWYYEGEDFPVLQAIYPDMANRFPGEEGFDTRFAQPLLQPGAEMTRLESDLWDSNDPASSFYDWKFEDPPHTQAFLSEAVQQKGEPVTYVSHDADDGCWQFLGDSMAAGGGPVLSCLHHLIDEDRGLIELADLPLGWYAERERVGEPWVRYQHDEGSEE